MKIIAALLALTVNTAVAADIKIFACEPEWGALATELAGDRASIKVGATAQQDVHYLQARPSLIAAVRDADLVVCSGAQLEIGWLPLLLRQASKSSVMPGQPGYLEAALQVPRLEIPAVIDRAAGDIHPFGNPHVQLDPRNIETIAAALGERLIALDPAGKDTYQARLDDFQARWRRALVAWNERATPLHGMRIVPHHSSWIYLAAWLDLEIAGYLEPKPGLPPTSGHLAELLDSLENDPPAVIIRAPYQSQRPSDWLSERIGAPAIVLPTTVGGTAEATDLFALFDDIINRLLKVRNVQ